MDASSIPQRKDSLKPESYIDLANRRGFVWLGPAVRNTATPTRWRCSCGHEWDAPYRYIRNGKGCPVCGNVKRGKSAKNKTPTDFHNLAYRRGFLWLGPEVNITKHHTWWECPNGHHWQATYNMIQSGKGCPDCHGTFINGRLASAQQIELANMLNGEVNFSVGSKAVDVAICVDGIKIAVEYDSWYWHGGKLDQDSVRIIEILGYEWSMLHIRSCSAIPTIEALNNAIELIVAGSKYEEIVLDDWGKGETWHDIKSRGFS